MKIVERIRVLNKPKKAKVGFIVMPKIHEDFMYACAKRGVRASAVIEMMMSDFAREE